MFEVYSINKKDSSLNVYKYNTFEKAFIKKELLCKNKELIIKIV